MSPRQPVKSRRGPDGSIWCPLCQAFRPASDFRSAPERPVPYQTRCRACEAKEQRLRTAHRALRDPAWYAAKLRVSKASTQRANARRAADVRQRRLEREQLVRAALDWLQGRGLWMDEIAALSGVHEDSLHRWRRGQGRHIAVAERILNLFRAASDVPAWQGSTHYRARDRVLGSRAHPAYALLRQRMQAAQSGASPSAQRRKAVTPHDADETLPRLRTRVAAGPLQ